MEQPALITVYITNHNYGSYIQESIESILQQTLDDYEIIIIDDGSTDHSREVIEQYREHKKIKIIYQQNQGLNVTNNIAMRTAVGKYIMRLDADDYLDANALLVMSNALEKNDELGLVFPDYYLVDNQGNIMNIEKRHDFDKDVKLLDQPAHGACTMIRREYLMKLNGYDERYECQDGYELWVKFTSHFKVKNISTPLFFYRQHGNNLTTNEQKILSTRASIKENFSSQNRQEQQQTLCVIPIRDVKTSKRNIPFHQLGGQTLLDHKITQAVKASKVDKVVISSPDVFVREYVETQYNDEKKVLFVDRPQEMARFNEDLHDTIKNVLDKLKKVSNFKPDAVMILSVEYPFITDKIINEAINTLSIFKSDSLISVRAETSSFFQHHGSGMKPILNQDKFTKLEREALYKYTGGIILVRTDHFESYNQVIGGKVGHIIIDQKAAQGIHSELDMEIAEYLVHDID